MKEYKKILKTVQDDIDLYYSLHSTIDDDLIDHRLYLTTELLESYVRDIDRHIDSRY